MYTAGLETYEGRRQPEPSRLGTPAASPPAPLKWLDLVALALALPVFIVGGFPIAGYLTGALAWLAQRGIQVVIARRASASKDPRTVVGLTVGSMIARGWLVALSLFLVGLSDKDAGLAAAVLVLFLFTMYLALQFMLHPFQVGGDSR